MAINTFLTRNVEERVSCGRLSRYTGSVVRSLAPQFHAEGPFLYAVPEMAALHSLCREFPQVFKIKKS